MFYPRKKTARDEQGSPHPDPCLWLQPHRRPLPSCTCFLFLTYCVSLKKLVSALMKNSSKSQQMFIFHSCHIFCESRQFPDQLSSSVMAKQYVSVKPRFHSPIAGKECSGDPTPTAESHPKNICHFHSQPIG